MAPEAIPIIFSPLIIVFIASGLVYRKIRQYKRYASEMVETGKMIYDVDRVMAVLILWSRWDDECVFLVKRLKEIQELKIIRKIREAKAPWRPENKPEE